MTAISRHDCDRFREHSVMLNSICWRLAVLLGDVNEGTDTEFEGDPRDLIARVEARGLLGPIHPLTEDEIVERVYRAHGNSPTPQLRPVLRRIWAAGLSVVEADGAMTEMPDGRWIVHHGPDEYAALFDRDALVARFIDPAAADAVAAALNAADPGPDDSAPERT